MARRDRASEPFHPGEVQMQELAGERAIAIRNGAILAPTIAPRALDFLRRATTLAAGALDDSAHLWASLWLGQPGCVSSEDGTDVRISRDLKVISADDPVMSVLRPDATIGMLAIDLSSRKRLRVNGSVSAIDESSLDVRVHEAFPNCPKYIQKREIRAARLASSQEPVVEGELLDSARLDLVSSIDTAFVSSLHADRGIDVSHRGGEPGFVRALDSRHLRVPDYAGNSMFLTMGNWMLDPRAGLALLDFERARMLALTGSVELELGVERPDHPSGGTARYWRFTVARWRQLPLAGTSALVERSEFNPPSRSG